MERRWEHEQHRDERVDWVVDPAAGASEGALLDLVVVARKRLGAERTPSTPGT